MYSDSISSASNQNAISIGSSSPKDFAKKKRGNRSAKLKQCKLDARREQWLSQVKQKSLKEKPNCDSSKVSMKRANQPNGDSFEVSTTHDNNTRGRTMEKLEINQRDKEKEEIIDGGSIHYSDSESSSNSPTSNISGGSFSGTTFTESSISRSNSSSGCFSGTATDDDEDDDDGGWEAIADALAATERKQDHKRADETSQSKPPRSRSVNYRAWRSDDTFRPQSLPDLSKNQYRFRTNQERCRHGNVVEGAVWGYKNVVVSVPSSCPICCEDLDLTDSSFLPCQCGFKLCLFCYKRIHEEDGRCPGCRKQYDHRLLQGGESALDGDSLKSRFGRS